MKQTDSNALLIIRNIPDRILSSSLYWCPVRKENKVVDIAEKGCSVEFMDHLIQDGDSTSTWDKYRNKIDKIP